MVHCVSDTCREELDQKWNFCPFCGTDNRPPEYRPKIRNCRHEFIKADGYCVDCGRKYGVPYEVSARTWQVRLGLGAMVLGALVLLAAFLIGRIHSQGHGPGYAWIQTWFDQPYITHGRYGSGYPTYLGREILTWMGMGGFFLVIGGLAALFPGRSRSQNYGPWS